MRPLGRENPAAYRFCFQKITKTSGPSAFAALQLRRDGLRGPSRSPKGAGWSALTGLGRQRYLPPPLAAQKKMCESRSEKFGGRGAIPFLLESSKFYGWTPPRFFLNTPFKEGRVRDDVFQNLEPLRRVNVGEIADQTGLPRSTVVRPVSLSHCLTPRDVRQ